MSGMWQSYKDKQLGKDDWHEPVDVVNEPAHYKSHPSGIEPIEVTKHENFNIGNCIKYIQLKRFNYGQEKGVLLLVLDVLNVNNQLLMKLLRI